MDVDQIHQVVAKGKQLQLTLYLPTDRHQWLKTYSNMAPTYCSELNFFSFNAVLSLLSSVTHRKCSGSRRMTIWFRRCQTFDFKYL